MDETLRQHPHQGAATQAALLPLLGDLPGCLLRRCAQLLPQALRLLCPMEKLLLSRPSQGHLSSQMLLRLMQLRLCDRPSAAI